MTIATLPLTDGPDAARALLRRDDIDAVQFARPPLTELPYHELIVAVLGKGGFRLDFKAQEPGAALAMMTEQWFGAGAFRREQEMLATDIAELKALAASLVDGPPPIVSVRTIFAPGDLVWHLDRMAEPASFRLLWAIGRPGGMHVTPASNVDRDRYRAFMRREHALLCQLDTRVMRSRADFRQLWSHRPAQVDAMTSGRFPFIIDPALDWQVAPDQASIHRVDTPQQPGTFHRSSWDNRNAPGFQIVITASGEKR